jgi:TfoX/Sxy family transcriptional regulator of competence genes
MTDLAPLKRALETATSRLSGVTVRKMFGCDGFFVDGKIFGLVWKTGRIGLKFPESSAFAAMEKLRGSEPWAPGKMTMAHWLLVPRSMHEDAATLEWWTVRAHALNAEITKEASKRTTTGKPKVAKAAQVGKAAKVAKVAKAAQVGKAAKVASKKRTVAKVPRKG